jgi:ABC-type transport system involved in multi-copper enzyme maturation permease subunit
MATAAMNRPRPGTGPATATAYRATVTGTLRSELTKLRSVRSTYWTLFLLVLAGVAWAIANCAGEASHWAQMSAQDRLGFDPTQASIVGLALLGQLVIVVLGALTITSEYSTGMIRTSLAVMPGRGVLYAAKVIAPTAVTLVIAICTSFASFFIGQYLLRGTHIAATLSQPDVLRAVLGSALYVVLSGLFAFGIGAIVRSTAGAMTTAYGLLFLLPQLAKALPNSWYADAVRWLPGGDVVNAVTGTQTANNNPHLFSAWGELAVFGAYAAIVLVIGALLFSRRDA